MDSYSVLETVSGFEWDSGNSDKNWIKHKVSRLECEEVFFNEPFYIYDYKSHSQSENRYYLLGITNEKRSMFLVFTIRKDKIRIISARDINKKERIIYEKLKKDTQV